MRAVMTSAAPCRSRPFLGGWYFLLPILCLALVREWWAPDEPRYAQIAKEAFETKSLVVLHLCGDLYPDKPPLVYWMAGVMGWLSGWSEFWMRVPSILATIGSAWFLVRVARRFVGDDVARWCVPFYLGTAMLLEIGGRLQLDPTLNVCAWAALDQLTIDDGDERATTRRTWIAGLCLGLGALAKGPPAWVPAGFALVTWRFLPVPFRFAPRRTAAAWIGLVVLAIAPVATWAAFAIHAEPALAKPLLFGQHVGRITKGDQHPGPVWDHLDTMPLLLLPWTLLVFAGFAWAARAWRARTDAGLVRVAAWFLVVFVFFSLIPPKRDLYLLPIYPAAALLAAFAFARATSEARLARWVAWPTTALVVVVGLALATLPFTAGLVLGAVPSLRELLDESGADLRMWTRSLAPTGCLIAVGGVVACLALRRRALATWADALGVGLALGIAALCLTFVPAMDEAKSARGLAELLRERPERPARIACVGVRPEGIRFYGGGPTVRDSLAETFASEGDQFLALCLDRDFERLPAEERARYREVGRRRLGSRMVLVLVRA